MSRRLDLGPASPELQAMVASALGGGSPALQRASKLSGLKACLARGDVAGALRIAARFPDLGSERAAILDAHGAITNPRFCRQLGKDPEQLIELGRLALLRRYPERSAS